MKKSSRQRGADRGRQKPGSADRTPRQRSAVSARKGRRGAKARQLELTFRTWGGARKGAGRKPKGARAGVVHSKRPKLSSHHPVHVTVRLRADVGSLRASRRFRIIRAALRKTRAALGMTVVHFSVQKDHLHLLVEAKSEAALSRGMQGLGIRLAKRLNFALGRRGAVYSDRYHARHLRSPLEVRRALVYVLNNHRKHGATAPHCNAHPNQIDGCSSAALFDGWRQRPDFISPKHAADLLQRDARDGPHLPVTPARSWLLRVGWRRHGLIHPEETPVTTPR